MPREHRESEPVPTHPDSQIPGEVRNDTKPAETPQHMPTLESMEQARQAAVRHQERSLLDHYDIWNTKASLLGKSAKGSPSPEANAIIGEMIDLLERENSAAISPMIDKLNSEHAKEYMHLLNNPSSGIITAEDVVKDIFAKRYADTLDAQRRQGFGAADALVLLRKKILDDLAAAGKPRAETASDFPMGEFQAEQEQQRRIDRAAKLLGENPLVLERFTEVRVLTRDNPAESSLEARKNLIQELIENIVPEFPGEKNVEAFAASLKASIDALLERAGANPEEKKEWYDLLLEAGAEDLRKEINSSAWREGGQSGATAIEHVLKNLLRDANDPVALKKKRFGESGEQAQETDNETGILEAIKNMFGRLSGKK
jgi:hypothetical protein